MELIDRESIFLEELKTWDFSGEIRSQECAEYIQEYLREILPVTPWNKSAILKHMPSIPQAQKHLFESYENFAEHKRTSQQDLEYFKKLNSDFEMKIEDEIADAIAELRAMEKSDKEDADFEHLNNLFYLASKVSPKTEFSVFASEYVLEAINKDGQNRKQLITLSRVQAETFLKKEFLGLNKGDAKHFFLMDLIPDFDF